MPGGGPSPKAASTLSPAASNASIGLIPLPIAESKPSWAALDIVSTMSAGAPISVITAPAASIAAEAAAEGSAPLSKAAV